MIVESSFATTSESNVGARKFNTTRLALVAFIGALILEIVLTFAVGLREAFTIRQIPAHLAALLVGSLGGWLFELFREMTITTEETMRTAANMQTSVQALTARITYQDEALNMLTSCPRHNDALTSLIKASMSENFRNIPLVGVPAYLNFLKRAIEHSDRYEGIQRKPFSWFKDTDGGSYLSDLKRRHMRYKTRLLIIDQSDEEQMERELNDEEILKYYWNHTGAVTTYWMTVMDFLTIFPGMAIPRDLALYDRQLLISYDERTQMLSFDVLNYESDVFKIFDSIDQLASHGVAALRRVPMLDQ
jgi:hypothetical protein